MYEVESEALGETPGELRGLKVRHHERQLPAHARCTGARRHVSGNGTAGDGINERLCEGDDGPDGLALIST